MPYRFVPMTRAFAQAVAAWHYDGEYSFYDFDQDPEDRAELLDAANWENRYFAALDGAGNLVGFFCCERRGDDAELGLGLEPDQTGEGRGLEFVEAGLEFARKRFHPGRFVLQVARFNRRAIRVYEKLGFRIERTFTNRTNGGEFEFVFMAREEEPSSPRVS